MVCSCFLFGCKGAIGRSVSFCGGALLPPYFRFVSASSAAVAVGLLWSVDAVLALDLGNVMFQCVLDFGAKVALADPHDYTEPI